MYRNYNKKTNIFVIAIETNLLIRNYYKKVNVLVISYYENRI